MFLYLSLLCIPTHEGNSLYVCWNHTHQSRIFISSVYDYLFKMQVFMHCDKSINEVFLLTLACIPTLAPYYRKILWNAVVSEFIALRATPVEYGCYHYAHLLPNPSYEHSFVPIILLFWEWVISPERIIWKKARFWHYLLLKLLDELIHLVPSTSELRIIHEESKKVSSHGINVRRLTVENEQVSVIRMTIDTFPCVDVSRHSGIYHVFSELRHSELS